MPAPGPYPQLRLYGQFGIAQIRINIITINSMAPMLIGMLPN